MTTDELLAEIDRLKAERDAPHVIDFLDAVKLEAWHQRTRWGTEHDAGKTPQDWFWLIGYLAGKALAAASAGDTAKALHHTVSSAAALMNWHAAISGADTRMRPGTAEPSPRTWAQQQSDNLRALGHLKEIEKRLPHDLPVCEACECGQCRCDCPCVDDL